MSVLDATRFDAALRTARRLGPEHSLFSRLRARVESFLAAGDLEFDRNFLIVRPAIAACVILATLVPRETLPGRDGVITACGIAIAYNFLLAYLVARKRIFLLRSISLLFDNATVIAASVFVFMRMGYAGYESDLWLIYLSLIVSSSMTYGPIGSLVFATLWTGLFVFVTLAFYDSDSYFRQELPMRLVFFVLTGFVGLSLSAELRKRRQNLEQKTRQTLTMLAQIVEARDTDAGAHLQHIQYYSRALALRMGIDEREANEIGYAGMIHDVGKANVPDAILKKPGPLTPDERHEIEQHTLFGDTLLSENEEFRAAREVARYHHERWDGGGYPDGLAGEDIPLAARIVAVADVYDALISERPYKRPWPKGDAIAEIRRIAGTHLDPQVVEAFVDLYATNVLAQLDAHMERDHDHESARAAGHDAAADDDANLAA
jgi:HD-GYP domain-containing protein (c-di-GMP phosphodiesterase class II)